MDKVLRCKTAIDPHDRQNPLKTVCYFKDKTYKRKIDRLHSERRNVREISDYLLNQGHHIENIVYPDIDMG